MFKNFIALSLLLSFCSASVLEVKWELISLNQKPVEEVRIAHLNFGKDGRIFGNLGCNNFFGEYKINEDKLEIGQVGSTMMMCLDDNIEREFSKVLGEVKGFNVQEDELIFLNEKKVEIAKFKKN